MPLYHPDDVHMEYTVDYQGSKGWSGIATTDASGNAIFQMLNPDGSAYFGTIFEKTIHVQPWSGSRILLPESYTVSADKKTITIAIKQNTSLLSLGLIPFSSAAAGFQVSMSVRGL